MMVLTFQVGRLLRTAPQFGGMLLRFAHKKTGTLRENAQMQAGGFKPIPYPQTPQSAARWFKRNGVCKAHWRNISIWSAPRWNTSCAAS